MEEKILVGGYELFYNYKISLKSRRVRIAVSSSSEVTVTAPKRCTKKQIEYFLKQKIIWIINQKEFFSRRPVKKVVDPGITIHKNKNRALKFVRDKVKKVNQFYNFKYSKIFIKNQGTRWGSCSSKGNLSFNYKLFFLPEELSEYIVAHELCHLKEMNHSKNFWNLVAQYMPEYKSRVKELRKYI